MNESSQWQKSRPHIFVLTRFAVVVEDLVPYPDLFTEEWFLYRLNLLRLYTAPSLIAQTYENFSWYLFVAAELPKSLDEEISRATLGMGRPIRQRKGESLSEAFRRLVRHSQHELFTVRVDSDDALGPEFLEQISNLPPSTVGSFPIGVGLDAKSGKSWLIIDSANAFIAFNAAGNKTVFELGDHNRVYTHARLDLRLRTPMWVQISHGKNLANEKRSHQIPLNSRVVSRLLSENTVPSTLADPKPSDYLKWAANMHKFLAVALREATINFRGMLYRFLQSETRSGTK